MRARADDRPLVHELTGPDDERRPLTAVVHPGVLPASDYQGLADELAKDSTVVVLDVTGIPEYWQAAMEGRRPDITIEEIADRFVAELGERAAAASAVVLVGWSFGGVIAYAMVQRWSNDSVDLLLLDSMAPAEKLPTNLNLATPVLLSWFAKYLGAKRGGRLRLEEDRFALTSLDDGLAIVRDTAAGLDLLSADTAIVGLRKLYDTFVDGLVGNTVLTNPYQPEPTDRELTLVKPEGSLRPRSKDLGWSGLAAGGLLVRPCDGDHYTMLVDPGAVTTVAGAVREKTDAILATTVATD